MPFRALLFDFDGLLADTEPLHFEGFKQVVAQHGIELSDDLYYDKYVGYDDRDGFAAICRDAGRTDLDQQTLCDAKASVVESLMRSELQAIPGAVDFVLAAHERDLYEIGICSGALHQEVQLGIESLGIAHCFQHIVAADHVAHSKPDPTGYQMLATRLSEDAVGAGRAPFSPAHCCVLEDTLLGLQSGRDAGAFTIGVVGTETAESLQGHADFVANGFTDIDLDTLAVNSVS